MRNENEQLNHAHAHAYYSHYLMFMKRNQEAIEHSLTALDLDPMNPLFRVLYAIVLTNLNRHEESMEQIEEARRFGADNFVLHDCLQSVYYGTGRHEENYQQQMFWFSALGDSEVANALEEGHGLGGPSKALENAADTLAARAASAFVPPESVFLLYAMAGEKEKTIEWLERGLEARSPFMPYTVTVPPLADARRDPRVEDLHRRMGLAAPQMG